MCMSNILNRTTNPVTPNLRPMSPVRSGLSSVLRPLSSPPWLRRLLWLFLFCLLLSGLCYAFRAPLLTALANAWIINDAPEKSDAIVVLGGGIDYRPYAAAQLYKRGYAPKVLIMDVILSQTEEDGIKPSERSLTRT